MKKLLTLFVVPFLAQHAWHEFDLGARIGGPASNADGVLAAAFDDRRTDFQVQGRGTVARLLADDNSGSGHQRFILQLDSGQTLMVAHNIDLVSRAAALATGDTVKFHGEYEWNPQGGVIHRTHHDPARSHVPGWL